MSRTKTASYKKSTIPCKYGHVGDRYSNGNCVQCLLEKSKERQKDPLFAERKREYARLAYHADIEVSRNKVRAAAIRNKDMIRKAVNYKYATNEVYRQSVLDYVKAYRKTWPDRVRWSNKKYYLNNKLSRSENSKRYRATHLVELREYNRAYCKAHYRGNKSYYWLKTTLRAKRSKAATPSWIDKKAMIAIKSAANKATLETGILHSVDHIVPLHGVNKAGLHVVCGFNSHHNLQVMPLAENLRKSNKYYDND